MTADQERELLAKVRDLHAQLCTSPGASRSAQATPRAVGTSGTSFDRNDPVVKLLPRNWPGEDLRGKRYSECPPNFLGMLAHVLDAFADKAEQDGDPQKLRYAKWDRENAETARRWREQLEAKGSTSDDFGPPDDPAEIF